MVSRGKTLFCQCQATQAVISIGICTCQVYNQVTAERIEGLVYAGLGRKEDAIREGLIAVEKAPISRDHFTGSYIKEYLTRIYVMVGEYEKAIDQLEFLLPAKIGLVLSPALLRVDPIWDPLRDNPRFKQLVKN